MTTEEKRIVQIKEKLFNLGARIAGEPQPTVECVWFRRVSMQGSETPG